MESLGSQYQSNVNVLITKFGENHPKVAEALNIQGLYHHHMSRNLPVSLQHHEQALKIYIEWDQLDVSEHILITILDIANVHRSMGNKKKAYKLYNKALNMFRSSCEGRRRDFWIFSTLHAIESLDRIDHNITTTGYASGI